METIIKTIETFLKKYTFTNESKIILGDQMREIELHRIKALKNFGNVKAGDIGGWVEKESNLSQKGDCWVGDNARVFDDAEISDNAIVYGNAKVCGDAIVYGNAKVCGNAKVIGEARISQQMVVSNNVVIDTDLADKKNIQQNLMAQCGLLACDGKVTCYKQVRKNFTSYHDVNFKYKVGEWIEVEEPDLSDKSCAAGLHFSSVDYWAQMVDIKESVFLIAEVDLNDIITIQEGKIRCKRAFIKGSVEL